MATILRSNGTRKVAVRGLRRDEELLSLQFLCIRAGGTGVGAGRQIGNSVKAAPQRGNHSLSLGTESGKIARILAGQKSVLLRSIGCGGMPYHAQRNFRTGTGAK